MSDSSAKQQPELMPPEQEDTAAQGVEPQPESSQKSFQKKVDDADDPLTLAIREAQMEGGAKLAFKEDIKDRNSLNEIEQLNRLAGNVGRILMKARVEKGIDHAEVCRALNIHYTYLHALENDDYDNLPEAPYVVGFVRAYARLVSLNEEEIVRRLKASGRLTKTANHKGMEEVGVNLVPTRKILLLSLGVFALLLLLLAGYLSWRSEEASSGFTLPATEQAAPAAAPSVNLHSKPQAARAAKPAPQAAPPVAEETVAAPEAADERTDAQAEQQVEGTPVDVAELEQTAPAQQNTVAANEDVAENPLNLFPNGRVVFQATDSDVWMQIKDADTQRVLVNRIVRAGTQFAYDARPGALVDIGKPESMVIRLDGQQLGNPAQRGVIKNMPLDKAALMAYFRSASTQQ